jgi:hypothetical protein
MNKRHPHNSLIERKLEQLSNTNPDQLWNDMHSILDKKMPQRKQRRRFIALWLIMSKPIFLVPIGVIIITGSSLLLLSKNESSVITKNKTADLQKPNKNNTDAITKNSQADRDYATTDNKIYNGTNNKISITAVLSNPTFIQSHDKNFIALQTKGRSENYKIDDQYDQTVQSPMIFAKHALSSVELSSNKLDFFITKDLLKRENSLDIHSEDLANNSKKNGSSNNESGFYAGIMSGVDLSSINFRSAKTGSTKGFILGYALNKKWSIESGLFWDTKRVSDNGNHFDPPGYTPSSIMTITAVNGKNRLYEVPVNIKYSIVSGKHNLFATTGLSSYFMRSENYDYEYTQNNQPAGHNYLNYTNQSKNWFSVVNLSVGYTHKFGATGSLRVEPYLKLPLKDLGVGNMPITSTGLNIGFIKTIR